MTSVSDNFIYIQDDIVPIRIENTFESFLENYFNNVVTTTNDDDYIDLESILTAYDTAEEVITTFDNLTQFQRSIVTYLSGNVVQSAPTQSVEVELTEKEKCERDGLEYNEHRDNCCKPGQEYYRKSKRCRKKQRLTVTVSDNVTVIEKCERDGVAYNAYTKKCCKPGQVYLEGNKRCTKPKLRSPPPSNRSPGGAGPSNLPQTSTVNNVERKCIKKGLAYNRGANKCCSNKSMEYISGKRCKKKKPRSPSGPVITSPS